MFDMMTNLFKEDYETELYYEIIYHKLYIDFYNIKDDLKRKNKLIKTLITKNNKVLNDYNVIYDNYEKLHDKYKILNDKYQNLKVDSIKIIDDIVLHEEDETNIENLKKINDIDDIVLHEEDKKNIENLKNINDMDEKFINISIDDVN